jgi:hypothetical protein
VWPNVSLPVHVHAEPPLLSALSTYLGRGIEGRNMPLLPLLCPLASP